MFFALSSLIIFAQVVFALVKYTAELTKPVLRNNFNYLFFLIIFIN